MASAKLRKCEKFPHEIRMLNYEMNERLSAHFFGDFPQLVQVGPQKMLIPGMFRFYAENYYNFQLRPKDVFVTGFPCSGTLDVSWLLLNYLKHKKNEPNQPPTVRVPLLEAKCVATDRSIAKMCSSFTDQAFAEVYASSMKTLTEMEERRLIRTHLHLNFLPKNLLAVGCKTVYIARHPKAVIASMYNLQKISRQFNADFDTYVNDFMTNSILFTPYWAHLEEAWRFKHSENMKFLYYEDIMKNLRENLVEIITFLGKAVDEKLLDETIESFKNVNVESDEFLDCLIDADDDFISKEKPKSWKTLYSSALNKRVNNWMLVNLARTGIDAPFKI